MGAGGVCTVKCTPKAALIQVRILSLASFEFFFYLDSVHVALVQVWPYSTRIWETVEACFNKIT